MFFPSKPYIDQVVPYEPGRPIEEVQRELGIRHLVKLASNENPLGVSPKARRALQKLLPNLHYYPESTAPELLKALAKYHGVSGKQIILGNGSNEIIEFLCRALLSEGDEVVSGECSFLVYPLITQICGGRFRVSPMKDFAYDLDALGRLINAKTRLVFIANPNNPTGTYVTQQVLARFLSKVGEEVIVCLDEAYADFADAKDYPRGLNYLKQGAGNVIVLRTFSKSHGLAGLRIGYGIGSERLIQYLQKVRQPFNVNAAAQVAARAALEDKAYLRRAQKLVKQGRMFLYKGFDRLGLKYVRSQANFVLVDLGTDSKPVVDGLLKKGLIVRGVKAYNLPTFIRVSIGLPAQNTQFIKMLDLILRRTKGES
ncbi:MAG: histidinol-phosphate transaminase [Candidatus Omnitrophica bacterium]|nr:histidinol-phosphate transaminase [Candidatus Omnitrophota bacterium]